MPFVLGMVWFTENFQTSHDTYSTVLVQALLSPALGVSQGGFEHDWDEDKLPVVVLFGVAAGLLMVMPRGQVIVGVLMAGAVGFFSWASAEVGLCRRWRTGAGR